MIALQPPTAYELAVHRLISGLILEPEPEASAETPAPDPALARAEFWRAHPVEWVQERLHEHVWSKQCAICESVRDHRYTAVKSCHGAGKSFIAARIAAWFLSVHQPGDAFVVTSAPTWAQVRTILWREINRAHARGGLPGRVNQTEWFMTTVDGREEIVAFGRKPKDIDATGFQGIHARRVLVIFDEACGIPKTLWDAADTLVTNEDSRWLAIGNPDDPTSEFAEVCKPGSGWNVIRINAFDTPNFTNEPVPDGLRPLLVSRVWVEEKRRKWGESNPLWVAKVTGDFPDRRDGGLFPIAWIKAAQERALGRPDPPAFSADTPEGEHAWAAFRAIRNELGVDVGGGSDHSTVAHRHGGWARIVSDTTTPDTMQTTGEVIRLLDATGASVAKIDKIGIGRGVVDRGLELNKPFIGVNVSLPPDRGDAEAREGFVNLRAEYYWALRDRFRTGDLDLDPEDEDLAAQLVAMRYKVTSRGQIQIESKEDMRKRGLVSPDRADALMLAFARAGAEPLPDGLLDVGAETGGGEDYYEREL